MSPGRKRPETPEAPDTEAASQAPHPPATPAGLAALEALEIRVGEVIRAEPFPEARKPAIKLWIDFGPAIGVKASSAQIAGHYTPRALPGRQVLAATNLPPRRIGPFVSEVLVLGLTDAAGLVVLVAPDRPAPIGARLH